MHRGRPVRAIDGVRGPVRNGHRARPLNSVVMRPCDASKVVFALAVGATVSGCALLEWDKSKNIAYATLFDLDGKLDKPAYAAAFGAKFPIGSPVESVVAYVKNFEGACHTKQDGKLWCELPVRGGFCYAVLIGIEIAVKDGGIESTRIEFGGLGC